MDRDGFLRKPGFRIEAPTAKSDIFRPIQVAGKLGGYAHKETLMVSGNH
jgi:hypothetical protein